MGRRERVRASMGMRSSPAEVPERLDRAAWMSSGRETGFMRLGNLGGGVEGEDEVGSVYEWKRGGWTRLARGWSAGWA